MTYDREKENYLIAKETYGLDEEGFKSLDQIKVKTQGGMPLKSAYNTEFIKECNIDKKLYEGMKIYEIISAFLQLNVRNSKINLSFDQQYKLLSQMEYIATNQHYRIRFFDKHIIEFIRIVYHETNPKDDFGLSPEQRKNREKLYSFSTKMCCFCNPVSFSYSTKCFLMDLMCEAINKCSHQLVHFEALLALTQFTANDEEMTTKLYKINKFQSNIVSSVYEENQYLSNAAFELMSNFCNNDIVLNDIHEKKPIRINVKKCVKLAEIYLKHE